MAGEIVDAADVKWPATPYRSMKFTVLGEDDAGTWLWAPRGTLSVYAGREPGPLSVDFLTVVRPGAWWRATWMFGGTADLYVDIGCPPEWLSTTSLRVVDLDLDVVRWNDGRCEIHDEDEFAEHQLSLGYPDEVIASARECADHVLEQMRAGASPFGSAPARWLTAAQQSSAIPG